jgi:methylenetetrahydrofolate reductase (NADPH)
VRIADRLSQTEPCFSFEFFPPKSEDGVRSLATTLSELAALEPGFVSVTYGAGGSTRERTLDLVLRMRAELGIESMAHLTCMGHDEAELVGLLDRFAASGVENVLALRGDPPLGPAGTGGLPPSSFRYASELVRFIRKRGYAFCLGGAAYPEGHIECRDRELDLVHLKAKVDQGLDFLITQLFFDNAFYFDFVRRARRARIRLPIVPGIMPITNIEQITRFTRFCGATIPMRLALELEKQRNDPEAVLQLGVAHATLQCLELLEQGAPGIHFYTLNRSRATRMILATLRSRYPRLQDSPLPRANSGTEPA